MKRLLVDEPVNRSVPQARFRRVLSLWDLIFYGIVLIQPVAPIPLFGVVQVRSHGHMVDTIILAMFAMIITAFSYGRMASIFPSAGSAYTYVSRAINPHVGFIAGWAMFLDYLLQPILMATWVAVAIHRLLPAIPYALADLVFLICITFLNLRGVRATAKATELVLALMFVVIGLFFVFAVHFLFRNNGWHGIFSSLPFYDPKTFSLPAIGTATSLAALTYIGFDGVTTLAEDVDNPKRNVLLATVLVCLFTGLLSVLEIYLGQRIWPDYASFPNAETAFWDVCKRAGGATLFGGITAVTLIASFGSALTGTLAAARLLFGMGRDSVLPHRVFAHLSPSNIPTYNIYFVGGVAFVVSLLIDFERAAELLNFGAFLAFMGVNLAVFTQFYLVGIVGRRRHVILDAALPILGFLFCFWIWGNLPMPAKVVGGAWVVIGLTYAAIRSRGFREKPVIIDFSEA